MNGPLQRSQFVDRLQQAISRAGRHCNSFALLLIELRGEGDGDVLPRWGSGEDAVIRISRDGFALILEQIGSTEQVESVVNGIVAPLRQAGGNSGARRADVGVCIFPDDGVDAVTLMSRARSALQRARCTAAYGAR
jgi:GGDEF domain-containing protein